MHSAHLFLSHVEFCIFVILASVNRALLVKYINFALVCRFLRHDLLVYCWPVHKMFYLRNFEN